MHVLGHNWKVEIDCGHSICFKCAVKEQNSDELNCGKCEARKKIKNFHVVELII